MASKHEVRLARVYEEPEPGEGHRVLVDRLWPRGLRKDDPRIGQWLPEVAPSTELRRWYGHAPERYDEFVERYTAELETPAAAAALDELRHRACRAGRAGDGDQGHRAEPPLGAGPAAHLTGAGRRLDRGGKVKLPSPAAVGSSLK